MRLFAIWVSMSLLVMCGSAGRASSPADAQWIWCQRDRSAGAEAAFENRIEVDQVVTAAWLRCVGESAGIAVFLNGDSVAELEPYDAVFSADVTNSVRRGENQIRVAARGCRGPSAFFLQLELSFADGSRRVFVTDKTWVAHRAGRMESRPAHEFGRVSERFLVPHSRRVAIAATDNYEQWRLASGGHAKVNAAKFKIAPGFDIQLVRHAGEGEGSWVSMTFDPHGRLIIAREKRGLLRMTPSEDYRSIRDVEVIDDALLECRGLLFVGDHLYANANNSKALFRLEPDGRGGYRKPLVVFESSGGVGHGRNDLALGPDGCIYSIHGDAVDLPKDAVDLTSPFRESRRGKVTREGHLLRIDPQTGRATLLAAGLRNPYGIAFNTNGDAFTYDADAEYDMGAPWYRPTRVSHLVTGGDYGWRGVTKQWPPYYPDHPDNALPNLDIGKGSPTAVMFGTQSNFPAKYREALFVLDWAYGRILAVHMMPLSSSYRMMGETFLQGRPLNVTDLSFGPDGALYIITGGRGTQSSLYRISYRGNGQEADRELTPQQRARAAFAAQARRDRRRLESLLESTLSASDWEFVWRSLGSDDPRLRYAARNVLERNLSDDVAKRVLQIEEPVAALAAMLALVRSENREWHSAVLDRLASLEWAHRSRDVRRAAAYCYWRILLENRELLPDRRRLAASALLEVYPDQSFAVNRWLSEILVEVLPDQAVGKTVALLQAATRQEEQLHYLFVLRNVRQGWTDAQRRAYFEAMRATGRFVGGEGMPTFLRKIREEALATLSEPQRESLRSVLVPREDIANSKELPQRPFVRQWTVETAMKALQSLDRAPDAARGAALFDAVLCSKCHRVGLHGASIGPDLTSVASRFGRRDLLTSMIEPSRVIAEKYRSMQIITRDGKTYVGQVVQTGDYRSQKLHLATDPEHPYRTIQVDKRDIERQQASPVSFMPEGLLNTLNAAELQDLVAFIESGGRR